MYIHRPMLCSPRARQVRDAEAWLIEQMGDTNGAMDVICQVCGVPAFLGSVPFYTYIYQLYLYVVHAVTRGLIYISDMKHVVGTALLPMREVAITCMREETSN